MVSAKESFLAAVNWFLRKKGHGAQAALADGVGFLRSYVSRALSGTRTPAIEFMEKVAIYYNMSLSEFLSFGEALAQGRPVCPFCHDLKVATPEERAAEIVSRTNSDIGIDGCLVSYRPDGWDEYVAGKITATEFYWKYLSELEALIERVKRL